MMGPRVGSTAAGVGTRNVGGGVTSPAREQAVRKRANALLMRLSEAARSACVDRRGLSVERPAVTRHKRWVMRPA